MGSAVDPPKLEMAVPREISPPPIASVTIASVTSPPAPSPVHPSCSGVLRAYCVRLAGSGKLRAPPLPARWTAVAIAFGGSFLGMLVLTSMGWAGDVLSVIPASFGATAVLVFAAPGLPMAQPRSVVGGQTLSALIGVALRVLLIELPAAPHATFVVAALAVAASIAAMMLCGVLHPAGAGTAMIAVTSGVAREQGWLFIVYPVLVGSILIVAVGVFWNNLFGDEQAYPAFWLF